MLDQMNKDKSYFIALACGAILELVVALATAGPCNCEYHKSILSYVVTICSAGLFLSPMAIAFYWLYQRKIKKGLVAVAGAIVAFVVISIVSFSITGLQMCAKECLRFQAVSDKLYPQNTKAINPKADVEALAELR
jgi:hypothetical protein